MITNRNYYKDLKELFIEEYKILIILIHKMEYYELKGEELYYGYSSDYFDGIYDIIYDLEEEYSGSLDDLILKISRLEESNICILYQWIKLFWNLKESKDIDQYVEMLFEREDFKELRKIFVEEYKILITLIHKLNYYNLKGEELYRHYKSDADDGSNQVIYEMITKYSYYKINNLIFKVSELSDDKTNLLYEWIKEFWSLKEKDHIEVDDYVNCLLCE